MPQLYEVKLIHEVQGQGGLNRHYYYDEDAETSAEIVCDTFFEFVLPHYMSNTTTQTTYKAIVAEDKLNTGNKFVLSLDGVTGDIANCDTEPSFLAWGFGLIAYSDFKQGGKRVAGVCDGAVTAGIPSSQIVIDLLTDLAEQYAISYLLEAGSYLVPVLARNLGDGITWVVSSIVTGFFSRVTTQNSRKPNHGGGVIIPSALTKTAIVDGTKTVSYSTGSYTGADTSVVLGNNFTHQITRDSVIPIAFETGNSDTPRLTMGTFTYA